MIKTKFLLSAFLIGLSLLFTSCGDEETGINKEKTKAALAEINDRLPTELENLNSSNGNGALTKLFELTDAGGVPLPFGRKAAVQNRQEVRDYVKSGFYSIRKVLQNSTINGKTAGDQPFNYNASKGVYVWNFQEEVFVRTGNSEILEIQFPTEGSNVNNATFKLSAYAEVATPDGDEAYSPTLVKATLFIGNVKEAELDLTASYGDEDQPVKANVYYFLNPFSVEVAFDDSKATSSSFSEMFAKNGEELIGFGFKVNYFDDSKSEEAIKSASGFVQLVNVRFVVNVNMMAEDFNEAVKIVIKVNGKTGGSIIFEIDETTGDTVPYVKYKDGSTESLQSILEELFLGLEEILG